MPRGRGKNYKGRTRHFTSAEEIDRQMNDDYRRKREDEDDESEESEEEETGKGPQSLIEVENPNRVQNKMKKAGDIEAEAAKPELTRKEREAIEKEQARKRYEKLHAEGKTDEARADLARLAIIKKQREEAAKKKEQDQKEKESKLKAAEEARKAAMEAQLNAPKPGGRRKKR
ncbi:28 kDa heat- and acid-stable phosphoprotein-like [Hydractinia symbiolongicarpus]|uniref:28 kDa heat- and acid-stable phosphoprotein-like n=1 Tax=Hydractinia symbiolongicarpus TaxID=13093 RepID=UPI0025513835|nr:28 kDa heat- and acid-stable phosphoprotein-like [Hydractinia symbiolongicarpus]